MKHLYLLLLTLSVWCLQASAQLDNTFNGTGRISAEYGNTTLGYSMLIQPADQYIVEAGEYSLATTVGVVVARFTKDGVLDGNFGSGGLVELPQPNAGQNISIGIQSNGSIIVCYQSYWGNQQFPILVRLTKTGQIDYSFNPAGYIAFPSMLLCDGILIQSDDKILMACVNSRIVRCTKDGVLDGTFATGGIFTVPNAFIDFRMLAFESDGSIVGVGFGNTTYQMVRVSSKGVQDMNFGSHGISVITVNGTDPVQISGITVITDDFIILSGAYLPAVTNPKYRALICELDAEGHFWPGFAGNGKLGIPLANYNAYGQAAVQIQGTYLMLAGYVEPVGKGPIQVGLSRITANGAIDYSFASAGIKTVAWTDPAQDVEGYSIAMQGQKIVVGGNLSAHGLMAMRFLNPIILPAPPHIQATTATALSSTASTKVALRLYPNPAVATLNIEGLDPDANTLLQVTDAGGRTMVTVQACNEMVHSLDVSHLAPGAYYLTVITTTQRKTLSFVRSR